MFRTKTFMEIAKSRIKVSKIMDCRWACSRPTSCNSFRITLREELSSCSTSHLLESKTRTSSSTHLAEAQGAKLDFLPILKPPVLPQGAHWTFCLAPNQFLGNFVQFKATQSSRTPVGRQATPRQSIQPTSGTAPLDECFFSL